MYFRIPSRRARRRLRSRGQSVVEAALALPILLILLAGAVDLGRLFYSQITITNAAREASLLAARGGSFIVGQPCGPTNIVMCAATLDGEDGLVKVSHTRVTGTTCPATSNASTPPVSVTVEADFDPIMPMSEHFIASPLTLRATADTPCYYVPAVALVPEPTPTPTPTPVPTPTPTGGPTPTPTGGPTPTPSPACQIVPNFVTVPPTTVSAARSAWTAAGFTGSFTPANGQNNKDVTSQNRPAGQCLPASTTITVTHT